MANRLKAARQEYVGPVAEEYVAEREAELVESSRVAWNTAISTRDEDVRLRALETYRRLNESRRKLRGADALDEAMRVAIEARTELESTVVAGAIIDVIERLQLLPAQKDFAFAVAQFALSPDNHPDPGRVPDAQPQFVEPRPYRMGRKLCVDVGGRRFVLDDSPQVIQGEVVRPELEAPQFPSEEPADDPWPNASEATSEPVSEEPPAAPVDASPSLDDVRRQEQAQWSAVPGYVGARVSGTHLSSNLT